MSAKSFVGAGLALLATSWAVPSSAAVVSQTKFKSESAIASFFESTPITCDDGSAGFLDTSVFVAAFADVVKGSFPGSTSAAFASYSQFNSCSGNFVFAFQNVPDADYEQSRTNSATLNASFQLFDSNTGAFLGVLDVGLLFSGVGPTTRQNIHSIIHTGDAVIKFRQNGQFREAELSGTIAFNGEDLLDSVQFAQLSDVSSGDMTVER